MSLILRVDVDKPYGHANLVRKVASKLTEDYWFPQFLLKDKYLTHLVAFLELCNREKVQGFIYFRTCTHPDEKVLRLLNEGGHKIGFHAENTRSVETFSAELNSFKKSLSGCQVDSFTKHGSGTLKLGKHHYAPYEPDKYKKWATDLAIKYYFGNGICNSVDDLKCENSFWPNMFWIEREYRTDKFSQIDSLVSASVDNDVVALVHPCNFVTSAEVSNDFKDLIRLSKQKNVKWKVF